MTGKHWSDKQNFEIWYTKLIAGPVCQTEAPLLFVSWTEMLSISPSRSPNQLDPLYATLSIGFLVFQLQFSCCNILALQTERDVDVVGN
jgi:hypothetical protein